MAKSLTGKAKHHPPVWNPNIDGGRFCNPVLFMDYSDPDVIRKGSDFFMAASSFSCFPGIPILHSTDLVNWSLISHVFDDSPSANMRPLLMAKERGRRAFDTITENSGCISQRLMKESS
ncbi:family 43 glycosylhydrolase [Bacillus licheniformis]